MNKMISPKSIAIAFGVLTITFLAAFYAIAWTEPTSAPPGANVPGPLNVGPSGQSKEGGLILNTGGAANGLIVQNGNVGIGTASPSQKLDVVGYVKGSTGLCIGTDCRIAWPSGGGGGGSYGVMPNMGLQLSGTNFGLISTCANGQLLKYNSTAGTWYCSADATGAPGGGITEVIAGTGLTGGGTASPVTLNVGAGSGISVAADTVDLNTAGISTCTDLSGSKIIWDSVNSRLKCATDQTGVPGSGYATIQDEAASLVQRTTLNFTGAGVTCSDDGSKTNCSIPGGGGGGTVTSVGSGTGLTGGPITTSGTLSLIPAYQDGSAYDSRFINTSGGDTMSGTLTVNSIVVGNGANEINSPGALYLQYNNGGTTYVGYGTTKGNLNVGGSLCLGGVCNSSWPTTQATQRWGYLSFDDSHNSWTIWPPSGYSQNECGFAVWYAGDQSWIGMDKYRKPNCFVSTPFGNRWTVSCYFIDNDAIYYRTSAQYSMTCIKGSSGFEESCTPARPGVCTP